MLWVCGAIRLESDVRNANSNSGCDSISPSTLENDQFDAWPSAATKDMMAKINERFAEAIENEDGWSDIQSDDEES